jgi:hypothetical protein
MSDRVERIGLNEALFRAVNEEMDQLSGTFTADPRTLSIVCECGSETCLERIEVLPDDYSAARADSTLFLTKPGHELPDTEHVVTRTDRFLLVRKDPGRPAEIARETDVSD